MDELWQSIEAALGIGRSTDDLSTPVVMLRALVVYTAALLIVRLGYARFMSKSTAFDLILAIMLGSVLSRAITGQSPLLPTVGAAVVLIVMHAALSFAAFHVRGLGRVVKGLPLTLVRDGEVDWPAMRKAGITRHDLEEALRMRGQMDVDDVRLAVLERNGDISVIARQRRPQAEREPEDSPGATQA